MNVLLLSMPDSFEHMPAVAIRMPNGALASLAGNVDAHHRVAIADLILAQASVKRTVEQLIDDHQPVLALSHEVTVVKLDGREGAGRWQVRRCAARMRRTRRPCARCERLAGEGTRRRRGREAHAPTRNRVLGRCAR